MSENTGTELKGNLAGAKPLPFEPETIDQLKARFEAAIREGFTETKDERLFLRDHTFDFDDGLRLHINRDITEFGELIFVMAIQLEGPRLPATLTVARAVINFAAISGERFGQSPEVAGIDTGSCALVYVLNEPYTP